ncbi:MAG: esterase-like activity of phytase family protein, partial [Candidatus Limnocylindrales bacterium]
GDVVSHFSAGTVDLEGIDLTEEELGPQGNGLIEFTESRAGIRREPDAVKWIDDDSFAVANEGDYEDADGEEGGSRGFTVFDVDGTVEYDAGTEFEYAVARAGHYPEGRSGNKGSEPEGLAVGEIGGNPYLFVASERGNIVAAYDISAEEPRLAGLLPTGMGPEGLVVTDDGVLVVTSEVDGFDEDPDDQFPVRSIITLYGLGDGSSFYPQLQSIGEEATGAPIPWVAISGMAGDPAEASTLWAVSDSFLAQPYIYRINALTVPALITERIAVGQVETDDQTMGEYDLEGIAVRPEGGFWLASEGRVSEGSSRPNLIVRAEADGTVIEGIELPAEAVDVATNSGLEGVAVTGTEAGGDETVWVVQQRPWENDAAGTVKVGRYDVASGDWTFAAYPLDAPESSAGGWVGLSEITVLPDGRVAVVERDDQLGEAAAVKRVYGIDPASVEFVPAGGELPVLEKTLLRDILPDLDAASISVPDKVESLAVSADGTVYLATDNDGVDENYGETVFIRLGSVEEAFGQ